MTDNSLICNFIKEHPYDWVYLLQKKGILVECDMNFPYQQLVLLKYRLGANFKDPLVCEARGIIINCETLDVVCRPFDKFFKNTEEKYLPDFDWDRFIWGSEKIDGSLIKLWYNELEGKWLFSTMGMIRAEAAFIGQDSEKTFLDLIKSADNYEDLEKRLYDLDRDCTYMFELVSPESRVVIKYDYTRLYYLAMRNNRTGEYKEPPVWLLNFQPQQYNIAGSNEDDLIKTVELWNKDNKGRYNKCNLEGMVVLDSKGNRIKIKSRIYQMLHNIKSNSKTSRKLLLEMVYNNEIDIPSIIKEFPEEAPYIQWYIGEYNKVVCDMIEVLVVSREFYKKHGNDKKDLAEEIADYKYSFVGFMGYDNDKSLDKLLENTREGFIGNINKRILDYKAE